MSTYARDERVSSIRKKGIIYMVLAVLAYFADFIPVLGGLFEFVIKIVAFIFLFLAVKGFAELSGSETIVKNSSFLLFLYCLVLLFCPTRQVLLSRVLELF